MSFSEEMNARGWPAFCDEVFGNAGAPAALLPRRIPRADEGNVVEAVTSLYRGDRYRMALVRRR